MRTYLFFISLALLFSCVRNNEGDIFQTENFILEGNDSLLSYKYVLGYIHKENSTVNMKEIYSDSAFQNLVYRAFFKNEMLHGPSYTYLDGELFRQSYNRFDKQDGRRTTYKNGKLIEEAFFTKGIKHGTWKDFDENGNLIRKRKFSRSGELEVEQHFDKEGKEPQEIKYNPKSSD
jgi:antitoxin component YwqK of YwqJK toxin-antitoxin module